MRCEITSKFGCSPAGCAQGEIGAFNIIDADAGNFARCDVKGCDEYEANFHRSGKYINVDVPGRGMLAKLSDNGAEYLEVVTLGTFALVSFGACRPQ